MYQHKFYINSTDWHPLGKRFPKQTLWVWAVVPAGDEDVVASGCTFLGEKRARKLAMQAIIELNARAKRSE